MFLLDHRKDSILGESLPRPPDTGLKLLKYRLNIFHGGKHVNNIERKDSRLRPGTFSYPNTLAVELALGTAQ
jgi:hypothetical protein